jgi:hypothetical protein
MAVPLPRTSTFTARPPRSFDPFDVSAGKDVYFFLVQLGHILDRVVEVRERFLVPNECQHVRLYDRDIGIVQDHEIGDVLQRAFAHDRQDTQPIPVVERGRQIGRDPQIGAVDFAREDRHRAHIDPGRSVAGRAGWQRS